MARLTSAACRAARAILKWSVRDLAREAGVSPTTINLLEGDRPYRQGTSDKIVAAFAAHRVEITNGRGTGARLLAAERALTIDETVEAARQEALKSSSKPVSAGKP